MNNQKDFAIGILSTTAVVLFAALAIIHHQADRAFAGTTTTVNGEYVVTVGVLTWNDEEIVILLNAPEEKLIAYRFDAAKRQIAVADGIDLSAMRQAPAQAPPPGRRRP